MSAAVALAVVLLSAAPGADVPVLGLDEALKVAKDRNLDLKVAQARLAQAREVSRKVWASYLPQVSVGGSYTRNSAEAKIALPTGYYIRNVGAPQGPVFDPTQDPSPENPPGAQTPYILFPSGFAEAIIQRRDQLGGQAQVSQALIAPVLWPAIQNAYLGEEVASLNVENGRREVLFAVAQLYYGAAGLKETVKVQQRLLEITRQHEKDAQVRVEAGAVAQSALLRAQIDRARAEQDLKRAENSYLSAKIALAGLLDRDDRFEVDLPPAPQQPADVSGLEDAAVRDRPDVAAAKVGVRLAEGQRMVSFMKYLPNVGVNGVYRLANVSGFTGQYDSWAITLGLNWTIFDGGLREAELRESFAKISEAEANRLSLERKARDEVARAKLDLESARSNMTKAAEQVKLARQNSELVNVAYREGNVTYLEVEDANAALLGSELAVVGETLNANLAALKLLKSAGAFNP